MLNHVDGDFGRVDGLDPLRDLAQVSLDVLALSKILWQLIDENEAVLEGVNDVVEVEGGEVFEDETDLGLDLLAVLDALLDLGQVILLDEPVDHTSHELLGGFQVDSELQSHSSDDRVDERHIIDYNPTN